MSMKNTYILYFDFIAGFIPFPPKLFRAKSDNKARSMVESAERQIGPLYNKRLVCVSNEDWQRELREVSLS